MALWVLVSSITSAIYIRFLTLMCSILTHRLIAVNISALRLSADHGTLFVIPREPATGFVIPREPATGFVIPREPAMRFVIPREPATEESLGGRKRFLAALGMTGRARDDGMWWTLGWFFPVVMKCCI
ncbi:MAG: hypothetical protein OHK0050_20270 [Roseiflexaceae bacterium]